MPKDCRTVPWLSTTTCFWPSTPINWSLYWRSKPALPITAPWSYLMNSAKFSSFSLISPTYPMTWAAKPFWG